MNEQTSAVPRSGWAAISSTAAAPGRKIGPAARRLRVIFGRAAIIAQACSTSASFMISAGWNWSGPAPSQRRAPLIRTPKPGISTSRSRTKATTSSSGVTLRTLSRPMRESTCITTRPTAPYITYLTR